MGTDAHTGASFSAGNRLARMVWNFVWLFLFRPSPRPLHGWRAFLLRLFGAKLGRGCHIYPGVRVWAPWNLVCDDEAGVGDGVILYNQAIITIGKRAVISQGAHLCSGSHDYESPRFELFAKPITIGDHAWLAAECFIHPGVTVGEGAVVGARSVVTRDVPKWMVCAGNPCQSIKPRVMKP
ncbi:MAG: WcaF family extracellular polysaccharide biosynthesis acetyltransferase [Chthoniobacteraceae bacterium]